jgi:hypothetical protein
MMVENFMGKVYHLCGKLVLWGRLAICGGLLIRPPALTRPFQNLLAAGGLPGIRNRDLVTTPL